jgi:hypothetical protein
LANVKVSWLKAIRWSEVFAHWRRFLSMQEHFRRQEQRDSYSASVIIDGETAWKEDAGIAQNGSHAFPQTTEVPRYQKIGTPGNSYLCRFL